MGASTTGLRAAVHARGDVRIRIRDASSGEIRRILEVRNTVVSGGFGALIALLNTADPGSLIARLRPGTGTTPPALSDTDVANAIAVPASSTYPAGILELSTRKTPALGSGLFDLLIEATIPGGTDSDPYNGKTISEAGLITAGGLLFARQIHPGISKVSTIAIDYEWRIRFLPVRTS
jgi:hypothetical protein